MTEISYQVLLGVDVNHLDRFRLVVPTWLARKPSLADRAWGIFVDSEQTRNEIAHWMLANAPRLARRVSYKIWRPNEVSVPVIPGDKWTRMQRQIMLAGFVYCPRWLTTSEYALKLDLDVVATEIDKWVDPVWFERDDAGRRPAIVAQKWRYTKPPNQMMELDAWVDMYRNQLPPEITERPPLELRPKTPESSMVSHERIISWCGFFRVGFVCEAARMAEATCGPNKLPVPSQDGFLWYVATRMGLPVRRVRMKQRGWVHRSTTKGILEVIGNIK